MTDEQSAKAPQKIEAEGIVEECLPSTVFRVRIDAGEKQHFVEGHLSGKMRMNYIKILKGDKVKIEISPYDITKARITYRYKN